MVLLRKDIIVDKEITLFELPIYGINESKLKQKVEEFSSRFPAIVRDACMTIYPQRTWRYNHIVGYIRIYIAKNDCWFDLYLPVNMEKYRWDGFRKVVLCRSYVSDSHFRLDVIDSNEMFTEMVESKLDYLESILRKTWYLDKRTYNSLNDKIDYMKIIEER